MTDGKEIKKLVAGQITHEDLEQIARLGSSNDGLYYGGLKSAKEKQKQKQKKVKR